MCHTIRNISIITYSNWKNISDVASDSLGDTKGNLQCSETNFDTVSSKPKWEFESSRRIITLGHQSLMVIIHKSDYGASRSISFNTNKIHIDGIAICWLVLQSFLLPYLFRILNSIILEGNLNHTVRHYQWKSNIISLEDFLGSWKISFHAGRIFST